MSTLAKKRDGFLGWGLRRVGLVLILAVGVGALGCSDDSGGGENHNTNTNDADAAVEDGTVTQDGGPEVDAAVDDGGYLLDASSSDACPPEMMRPCNTPVSPGCGSQEICDNGLDDDCDGEADEGCSCARGDVQECFLGPPNFADVGACRRGTQTCMGQEFGTWGDCEGGIWPTPETCDNLDNDCNGCIDDGVCCEPEGSCPSTVPDAEPFVPYVLDGTNYYFGTALAWSWTVVGGPCDNLLGDSFTVTGGSTETPEMVFTLSGDYTVTMTVSTPTGDFTCTFIVHVAGPGLRVELCWEGTGARDIDLHLLREDLHDDFGADWCDSDHDCHFSNCRSINWAMDSWTYDATDVSLCEGGPLGSLPAGKTCNEYPYELFWECRDYCSNPRLDIDNVNKPGVPENINVDEPGDGEIFRVMVHYYYGSGPANPLVNIYCDGHRIATYGLAPDTVDTFTTSGWQCSLGHTWRVADVEVHELPDGANECVVDALSSGGGGYHVRLNDDQYD